MYLELDARVSGFTMRQVRDYLRYAGPTEVTVEDAARFLKTGKRRAATLVRVLTAQGYLHVADLPFPFEGKALVATPAGRDLGFATGHKPIHRKTADRLLDGVARRARELNDDPDVPYWVRELYVFGAYLDPKLDRIEDLDVALDLRPCLADEPEQAKAERRHLDWLDDHGHRHRRVWDVRYVRGLTVLRLVGGSRAIRLSVFTGPRSDTTGTRQLFLEGRDLTEQRTTPAYQPPKHTPVARCSWCRREVPSTKVALAGHSISASPVALCGDCLTLQAGPGRSRLQYLEWSGAQYGVLRDVEEGTRGHSHGCSVCGRDADSPRLHLGRFELRPEHARFCSVCAGLLGIAVADDDSDEAWAAFDDARDALFRQLGLGDAQASTCVAQTTVAGEDRGRRRC
jgi:hypothetical protein